VGLGIGFTTETSFLPNHFFHKFFKYLIIMIYQPPPVAILVAALTKVKLKLLLTGNVDGSPA
jgi:hypothetical protein